MNTCRAVFGLVMLSFLAGCDMWTYRHSRIELAAVSASGEKQEHYAEFQQASYRKGEDGLVEFILESTRPAEADPKQDIQQIVYVRSYWLPIPGRTYMEASQINSQVQYAIITLPNGIRYDGAAFVSYKMSGDKLLGMIEGGHMSPRLRAGQAYPPFGPARFEGVFTAKESPRHVLSVRQRLDTEFTDPIPEEGTE